jgi:signal transduction histidine kinase
MKKSAFKTSTSGKRDQKRKPKAEDTELAKLKRRLQIEEAVEVVRTRSLKMRRSDELAVIAALLFKQFESLKMLPPGTRTFFSIFDKKSKSATVWITQSDGSVRPGSHQTPLNTNASLRKVYDAWKRKTRLIVRDLSGRTLRSYLKFVSTLPHADNDKAFKRLISSPPKRLVIAEASFLQGTVGVIATQPFTKEAMDTLSRVAEAFELTYTRFLDLQKAEVQARKALIETTLARVRARTMGMQKSEELAKVASVLFDQLRLLGGKLWTCGFVLCSSKSPDTEQWLSLPEAGMLPPFHVPHAQDKFHRAMYDAWKKRKKLLTLEIKGRELKQHYKLMFKVPVVKDILIKLAQEGTPPPSYQINYASPFKQGYFLVVTREPYPEVDLFTRFAKEFEQIYTRFLDLQIAEARAREAKIEAALEKVRARAMSMRSSADLAETVSLFFGELKSLKVTPRRCGVSLIMKGSRIGDFAATTATEDGNRKEMTGKLLLAGHPVLDAIYDHWVSQKEYHPVLRGDEIRKYYKVMNAQVEFPDFRRDASQFGHYFFFKEGFVFAWTQNELKKEELQIFRKFTSVLSLTYRRYIDLQKAEAQAREAEIELGLERVRARAMAMQTSEELNALIGTVFTELTKLDLVLTRCRILIYEGSEKGARWWMANSEIPDLPMNFFVDYADMPFFNAYLKAWHERALKWQYVLEGRNKIDADNYIFTKTELSRLPEVVISGMREPERIHLSASFNNFGCLSLASLEPLSSVQIDILSRFGKVFDLTYTRFNDLKQAEAQAREAHIEAALERVRSRAMAMHKSEELQNVVSVVFEQLQSLNFALDGAAFIATNVEDFRGFDFWMEDKVTQPARFRLPYYDAPSINDFYDAWEKRKDFVVKIYGKEKNIWFKYAFKHTDLKIVPEDRKKWILAQSHLTQAFAIQKNSMIGIHVHHPKTLTDNEIDILKRFSKVFEQGFVRFRDLQKAEAQAREAQIQLALERVRAQTMAMHSSDDMGNCILKMFDELTALGVDEGTRFGIGILNHDNENNQLWTARKEGEEVKMHIGNLDMTLHPLLKSARKAWKEQVNLHKYVLEGDDLLKYYQVINNARDYKLRVLTEELPEREFHYGFIFSHGFFYAFSPTEFQHDLIHIAQRFSALFEQTYTRFLDLQKAEAQAREAEIELGLERVRARTMAMHKSDELPEVVNVMFHEFKTLQTEEKIEQTSRGFITRVDEKAGLFDLWATDTDGNEMKEKFVIEFKEPVVGRLIYDCWKRKQPYVAIDLSEDRLQQWFEYLRSVGFNLGPALRGTRRVLTFIYHSKGFIGVATNQPVSEENNQILLRFAKVFDQTYTRFLDLQKAEAQAREAQIETSLERVRAAAMAMHKSEDLQKISHVLYKEFKLLGLTQSATCGFVIVDEKDHVQHVYASLAGKNFLEYFKFPLLGDTVLKKRYEAWKQKKPVFHQKIGGSKLKKHMDVVMPVETLTEEVRISQQSMPDPTHFYCGNFSQGYLQILASDSLFEDQVELIPRFAKVFEQAYTRFLDLQKAEAQARDAQIEAALEKVRSHSLAMHKADELGEVASVVFEKLRELDLPVTDGVAIVTHIEGSKDQIEWMESPDYPSAIKVYQPYYEHPILADYWKAKDKGLEYIAPRYTAEQSRSFLKHIFEFTDYKHTPQEIKDYCLAAETYSYFAAFQKHSSIFINDYSGRSLSGQEIDIIKRFSKVFEQAYVRFLDLQKAEAQAREGQNEAALERVRSRSMGMQKSEELKEVIKVVYDQLVHLNINVDHAGFVVDYVPKGDWHFWIADTQEIPSKITHPWFDSIWAKQFDEAKEKGIVFFATNLNFEEKNKFYQDLFSYIPGLSEQSKEFYFNCPGLAASNVLMESVALYIENFSAIPYSDEENKILMRFGKVFQQTYTRFLDLQKAEAQAREAQIEAALERVRSRSIAMRKSEEIADIAGKIFSELRQLDLVLNRVLIWTFNDIAKYTTWWSANPEVESTAESYRIDYNENPVFINYLQAWQQRKPIHLFTLSGDTKKTWEDHLFEHTEMSRLPMAVRKGMREESTLYTVSVISDYGLMMSGSFEPLSEASIDIIQRFGRVFQQSYTRYLDVQKAEAQAREAQIEAALERVRSRTMGMQRSDELKEAAMLLFQEVLNLGVPAFGCGFNIWDEDRKFATAWMAGQDRLQPPFRTSSSEDIFLRIYEAAQKGESLFVEEQAGEALNVHYAYMNSIPVFKEIADKMAAAGQTFPIFQIMHCAFFSHGYLMFISFEPVLSAHEIFKRFAKVFEQTYTRFLDLQKAEAQAREVEIQLALERVRAKTMSMQNSTELADASFLMANQIRELGIKAWGCAFHIYADNEEGDYEWFSNEEGYLPTYKTPRKDVFKRYYDVGQSGQKLYTEEFAGEACVKHYNYLMSIPIVGDALKDLVKSGIPLPSKQIDHVAFFKHGYLLFITYDPVPEAYDIFKRFASEFEQTYTRFLDLQKAEVQAREAQIEAALERVRSRTMAMHKSDELSEAANVMHHQFRALTNLPERIRIAILVMNPDGGCCEVWVTGTDGSQMNTSFKASLDEPIVFSKGYRAWKAKQKIFAEEISGGDWISYRDYLKEIGFPIEDVVHVGKVAFSGAYFSEGFVSLITPGPLTDETLHLLGRFAGVFDLTYRRFLDLQKAEAQTREAQIEAALERLRSRSMAMQQSTELNEILAKVFAELKSLELEMERCVIWTYSPEDRSVQWWAANPEAESGTDSFHITDQDHPVYHEYWKGWEERRTKYLYILEGDNMVSWCDVLFYTTELGRLPQEVQVAMRAPNRVYLYNTFNDFGVLFLACLEPLSDDKFSILERFGKVFDQSYTRFQDIQKAEAREKEAIKQSSLDRVRGEIASMRATDDLQRITPLVWKELTALAVPFIRCGVFIVDEALGMVQTYLSSPDGHSLGTLNLAFDSSEISTNVVRHWRSQSIYTTHWNRDQFIQFMQSMLELGQIRETTSFQGATNPPESLHLHFAPFKQGMLYVGNTEPLTNESIDLVSTLAESFSIAYSRYEDFKQLEKAKSRVEHTLEELKAAQNQLIQSEKMASLGELTAGIAHEIKNPLNFVNNFSEVSNELIDEMNEEIAKGNTEGVMGIARDVKQNLEKILHHGRRADEIVKSMLMHSRSSTGVKEPTDINALADEYLRLAYHGLRAKDKSFNAAMESRFDESLGKIEVIPQDIGRVILNLITNAFYAVTERQKEDGEDFKPTVSVSTRSLNDVVEISVKDNGNGIPQNVIDKIFQPFFTTKPTGQGTGLGLSLSYDIVKAHGGELKVETKEGEGSEFVIALPVV